MGEVGTQFVDVVLPSTAARTGRLVRSLEQPGGAALVKQLWRQADPTWTDGSASPRLVDVASVGAHRVATLELPGPVADHQPRFVAIVDGPSTARVLASTPLPGGRAMLTEPNAAAVDRVIDGPDLASFSAALRVAIADQDRVAAPIGRFMIGLALAQALLALALWIAPAYWLRPWFSLATLVGGVGLFVWIYLVHAQLKGRTKFSPAIAVASAFIPAVGVALVPYVVFDMMRVARGQTVSSAVLVVGWWLMFLLALALSSGSSSLNPPAPALILTALSQLTLVAIVRRVSFGR